jgi:hypothetical protein
VQIVIIVKRSQRNVFVTAPSAVLSMNGIMICSNRGDKRPLGR